MRDERGNWAPRRQPGTTPKRYLLEMRTVWSKKTELLAFDNLIFESMKLSLDARATANGLRKHRIILLIKGIEKLAWGHFGVYCSFWMWLGWLEPWWRWFHVPTISGRLQDRWSGSSSTTCSTLLMLLSVCRFERDELTCGMGPSPMEVQYIIILDTTRREWVLVLIVLVVLLLYGYEGSQGFISRVSRTDEEGGISLTYKKDVNTNVSNPLGDLNVCTPHAALRGGLLKNVFKDEDQTWNPLWNQTIVHNKSAQMLTIANPDEPLVFPVWVMRNAQQ